MAGDFNRPVIANKITEDISSMKQMSTVLATMQPDTGTNVPDGAIKWDTAANTFKKYVASSSTWAALAARYAIDVSTLMGYSPSATATANTIAVRNATGVLPGDIAGNAATASTAATLSNTLPLNKGGTGATTAAAARTALGTNNISNITSGTLGTSFGGTGRTDGMVTDVYISSGITAKGQGGFPAVTLTSAINFNNYSYPGSYVLNNVSHTNGPTGVTTNVSNLFVTVIGSNVLQVVTIPILGMIHTRRYNGSSWSSWTPIGAPLSDSYTSTSSTDAASSKAVSSLKTYSDSTFATKTQLGQVTGSISIPNLVTYGMGIDASKQCALSTTNPNGAFQTGFYIFDGASNSSAAAGAGLAAQWWGIFALNWFSASSPTYAAQIAFNIYNSGSILFRVLVNGSGSGWSKMFQYNTSGNHCAANQALSLKSGASVTGTDMTFTYSSDGSTPTYLWGSSSGGGDWNKVYAIQTIAGYVGAYLDQQKWPAPYCNIAYTLAGCTGWDYNAAAGNGGWKALPAGGTWLYVVARNGSGGIGASAGGTGVQLDASGVLFAVKMAP